jgi:hypothetical protein
MKTKDNFFKATKARFKGCKRPKRKPDYVSIDGDGRISSEYWYTERGVIRCSDHWTEIHKVGPNKLKAFECGWVARCLWSLSNPSPIKGYEKTPCGFCAWENFE